MRKNRLGVKFNLTSMLHGPIFLGRVSEYTLTGLLPYSIAYWRVGDGCHTGPVSWQWNIDRSESVFGNMKPMTIFKYKHSFKVETNVMSCRMSCTSICE